MDKGHGERGQAALPVVEAPSAVRIEKPRTVVIHDSLRPQRLCVSFSNVTATGALTLDTPHRAAHDRRNAAGFTPRNAACQGLTTTQFSRFCLAVAVTPESVNVMVSPTQAGSGLTVMLPPSRAPAWRHSLQGWAQQVPLAQQDSPGSQVGTHEPSSHTSH